MAEFPEVEDCFSVAGKTSYVLKVPTRTTTDLEDLIRRLREKASVATRTTIVLSIPFEAAPLAPLRTPTCAPSAYRGLRRPISFGGLTLRTRTPMMIPMTQRTVPRSLVAPVAVPPCGR